MNKVSLFEVALTDRRVKQPQHALGIRFHVCFFWPVYGFIDRTDCDMTVNRMRERGE